MLKARQQTMLVCCLAFYIFLQYIKTTFTLLYLWTKTSPNRKSCRIKIKGLELVRGGSMEKQKIKNDENNTIGKNIRDARQKAGIGQTELVGRLQLLDIKMTRETLVKIERGVQHIQLEQLKGIKEVLGVSYEKLLD